MNKTFLNRSNVHLWSAPLDVSDQVKDALSQSLSLDEWKRADNFVIEKDRRKFIVARGILRDILAEYLYCHPRQIRFHYQPHGKPELHFTEASVRFEFNLSHSSGLLVLAISLGKQVGVDIERIRPLPDLDSMVSNSFSDYERNILSTLAGEEKLRGFFRCWTRKEAYLKARGDGLLIPLDTFDMSLAAHNPIRMLSNRLDPHEVSRWSFFTFIPEQGFIGALAVEGQGAVPEFKRWTATDF